MPTATILERDKTNPALGSTEVRTVLMPLPDQGFDPTEAAITWWVLRRAGHKVQFATESGSPGSADPLMLSGEGLDPWGFLPILRKFKAIGLLLRASRSARDAYAALLADPEFRAPRPFSSLQTEDYDGLILPGGHAKTMRPYLESEVLQRFVADFFASRGADGSPKPVGAVCHGVVLAARSRDRDTGRSVLHGRYTTALTWSQEQAAWRLTRYFARFWDPDYYRTYVEAAGEPLGYWGVEQEVRRALADRAQFLEVSPDVEDFRRKTDNLHRDTLSDATPAWVVRDGNYLSARWPGDVHTFAQAFVALLDGEDPGVFDVSGLARG